MPVLSPLHRPVTAVRRRIGMLSTYPPKLCGLATFASALEAELIRAGHRVDMVRLDDGDEEPSTTRAGVVATLVNGDPASIRHAAAVLSRCDVTIIQHEYGIFGGPDGQEVVDLLMALDVPVIVVLHTVPLHPTDHQRSLLVQISQLADRVVVMTHTGAARLTGLVPIDAGKVEVIPHGASLPLPEGRSTFDSRRPAGPQLLTWGLLGPGKGVEHVIDALSMLRDVRPRPRYTVAGVTHPKVLARVGDQYRHSLIERSWALGLAGSVTFDDSYRDLAQLTRFIASASVVVLPYDSRDQVTSGVLVDAIAAGRPVIATAFPHAIELLGSGAGIVVPQADPVALAAAIRMVLSDDRVLAGMEAEARRLAPTMGWTTVAGQYTQLCDELVGSRESVAI